MKGATLEHQEAVFGSNGFCTTRWLYSE